MQGGPCAQAGGEPAHIDGGRGATLPAEIVQVREPSGGQGDDGRAPANDQSFPAGGDQTEEHATGTEAHDKDDASE
jgi:hypothetical protein